MQRISDIVMVLTVLLLLLLLCCSFLIKRSLHSYHVTTSGLLKMQVVEIARNEKRKMIRKMDHFLRGVEDAKNGKP